MKVYIKNQGDYLGKYSFTDAEVGDSPPTDWSFSNPSSTVKCSIVETSGGHKKVLRVYDEGAGFTKATQVFSSAQNNGIIELWIKVDDVNEWIYFHMLDDTLSSLIIRIRDGNLQYYKRTTSQYVTIFTPSSDTWYRLRCDFDCDGGFSPPTPYSGSMTADTANVYIYDENNILLDSNEDLPVPLNPNIDRFRIESDQGGQNVKYAWFDAIDYSWADGWYVGRNANKVADIEITSEVMRNEIVHKERDIPKATMLINSENVTFEPDDTIIIRDIATSYFYAKIDQAGVLYKGFYNFRNATLRSAPSGWTAGGVSTNEFVIDKFEGHARVVWLEDDQGANVASMYNNFASAKMSGTIELHNLLIYTNKIGDIQIKDGSGNICCWLRFDNDGNLYYITNNGATENALDSFTTYTGCTWYHIKLVFNATANTYDIYVDGTLEKSGAAFNVNDDGSGLTRLMFTTDSTETGGIICFDSVEYSWATGYYDGRNKLLDVTLADQVVFEGMIISADKQKDQKIKLVSLSDELKNIMPGTEATKYEPVGLNADIANQSEEVLAQIINEKCNTVKVKIWEKILRGNLSFENDTDGAIPMGFRNTGTLDTVVDVTGVGGHQYILKLNDTDNTKHCRVRYYVKGQESGTVEGYIRSTDVTCENVFFLEDSALDDCMRIRLQGGDCKYKDGTGWNVMFAAANDTWYRIRIDFECGTGAYLGLAQYTFNLYVYNSAGTLLASATDKTFINNISSVHTLIISTSDADQNYIFYADAIGFSWSPFYKIGDNNHIYVERFETGALKMDLALDGSKTVKKIADTLTDLEVFTWILTPDHYLVFTEGNIDSQVDLSASEVWKLKAEQKIKRINKVWVKGGWGATNREYGSADDPDSQATYGIKLMVVFYTISAITSELNNIAQSLLTFETGVPEVISFWYSNENIGFILPLQTVTVPASTIYYSKNDVYIEGKQWILNYIKYLPMQKWCDFDMVDNLMFEYDIENAQELEYLINNP